MIRRIFYGILGIALAFVVFDVAVCVYSPDVKVLRTKNPARTAFMRAREEAWRLRGERKTIRWQWVSLAGISPYLVKAVIIAEDDKFWSHEGFDFDAMQKALEKDLRRRSFHAGGSTITQQLAKNLYLSPSKNPVRKLKEAILSWRIERHLTKRRIVELYLNVAEWGDGIFGIEAAARHHFGKGAADLSAREASRLAAVLPNPRRFDPAGDSRYVDARAARIYGIMLRRGIVLPDYEEISQASGNGDEAGAGQPREDAMSATPSAVPAAGSGHSVETPAAPVRLPGAREKPDAVVENGVP